MKVKVQLVIESDNGDTSIVNQVGDWQRDERPTRKGTVIITP